MQRETESRPTRRVRGAALGIVGAVVAACGVVGGGSAAFASSASDVDFSSLHDDFAAGLDDITVGADITQTDGTLTLGAPTGTSGFTTLHLNGKTLTVQGIELTSAATGSPTGLKLVVTGAGSLNVTQTDTALPAIEVSAGSTLIVSNGTITASVPASSTAAAIGGGPSMGPGPQDAGVLTFNGLARVTANGGLYGAGIGGGYGGTASPTFDDSARVVATTSGGAAAIGNGYGSAGGTVTVQHSAYVEAHQLGSGNSGAGIGGGASPTGQNAGVVNVGDDSQVVATSAGKGAAIGGGYHGDGGQVNVTGYASVTATADPITGEAGIGDGDFATGSGSTVNVSNATSVTAVGGGAGGAGIGGGANAYGYGSLNVSGTAAVTSSSVNGPGIGGQRNRNSFGVNISGASTVIATGGGNGAGIGGGDSYSSSFPSVGATVSIGAGALVTVAAAAGVSAIGAGTGTEFGTLSNAGTLTLASGSTLTIPAGITAGSSGSLVNGGSIAVTGTLTNSGVITNSGALSGIGTIDNTSGTIKGSGSVTTSHIVGNNFRVTFDPAGGAASYTGPLYVYTDTFASAGLSLPTLSSTPGPFTGWNTASDGSGDWLTTIAPLATIAGASSSDGSPVSVQLHALYLGVKGPASRVIGGAKASLRITGLRTNETYVIKIGSSVVATAKATSNQTLSVSVPVPKSVVDGSQTVSISGDAHSTAATSTILTAAASKTLGLKLSATRIGHGKKLVVTASKLFAGESVKVAFTGTHSRTYTAKATSKGGYVLTLKSGLAKGKYTVTVTGAGTSRKASAKLTVS